MRRVILELDLFEHKISGNTADWSEDIVLLLIKALVYANLVYLTTHPNAPKLYESGVRYIREPLGTEYFQNIPSVMKTGGADCEDLASWRVAELIMQGEMAVPAVKVTVKDDGFRLYHIQVRRGDGSIEDPSALLGMKTRYPEPAPKSVMVGAVAHSLPRR